MLSENQKNKDFYKVFFTGGYNGVPIDIPEHLPALKKAYNDGVMARKVRCKHNMYNSDNANNIKALYDEANQTGSSGNSFELVIE